MTGSLATSPPRSGGEEASEEPAAYSYVARSGAAHVESTPKKNQYRIKTHIQIEAISYGGNNI